MEITKSTVTKLVISGAPALDPITVVLEAPAPGQGKILIECWGKSWAASWGGMGERSINQFFCDMDEHYLAKNLSDISGDIVDADSIKQGALREIIILRRGRRVRSSVRPERMVRLGRDEITAKEARALWDEVEGARFGDDGWSNPDLMQRVFGTEWWYRLPSKPNPEYQYLCRIIRAVQQALKLSQLQPQAA